MRSLALRKLFSAVRMALHSVSSASRVLLVRYSYPGVVIPIGSSLASGARVCATDGGSIVIGRSVSFGRNCEVVSRGGRIVIGDYVHVGCGSIIVSQDSVEIGRDTLIAEYVVIRDQDHSFTTRPIRDAGFLHSPIVVGQDCWIGAKATVLRGSEIGDGCVIGAHSMVRGAIAPLSLAVGCPARVVRRLTGA